LKKNSAILIQLLGGEARAGAVLDSVSWRFGQGGWPAGMAMLLVVAIGLAWLAYRRSPMGLGVRRRLLLTALRASFLALLGLVILQPLLRLTLVRNVPRTLLIGIDQSESFGLTDLQRDATRFEVATRVLTDSNLWTRLGEGLKLATYGFGDDLTAVASDAVGLNSLAPESPKTAVGSAVIRLLARHAGEPLAGIVLLTDGNNNHGPSLESAAGSLLALGTPLHIIGIGAEATIDSGIHRIEAPETALAGEVLPVAVRVRSQGLTGAPGEVVLSLSGQEVARRAFVFDGGAEQEVDLEFLPPGVGSYRIEAGVESGRQELVERNNRASQHLRVIETRMRVLMIEQAPRWEFKYLQAMLLREPRVELRCLLLEGESAAARVPGSPYLDSFPQREELLGYDLVFLGDVEPRLLTDAEWLGLKELVAEAGGALVVIAGKRFMPGAYRHRLLEPMLPIAPASAAVTPGPATEPWLLHPVRNDAMLRLADDPETQGQAWRELPPIFWMADIAGAKPAAEVLLVAQAEGADPADERGPPVAVLQRYGAGEVLFMGTDNTWRWRQNAGDRIHARFWAQVVQRLAGQRLMQGSRRASIQTDRRRYEHQKPLGSGGGTGGRSLDERGELPAAGAKYALAAGGRSRSQPRPARTTAGHARAARTHARRAERCHRGNPCAAPGGRGNVATMEGAGGAGGRRRSRPPDAPGESP